MADFNNLSDKDIRDLLKRRLLEQGVDDSDPLTQKLIDMEAKLAFSNEALIVPSLQKEKELFEKLNNIKSNNNNKTYKWFLLSLLIVLPLTVFFLYKNLATRSLSQQSAGTTMAAPQTSAAQNVTPADLLVESGVIEKPAPLKGMGMNTVTDSTESEPVDKWTIGDPGIKGDYKPVASKKHGQYAADPYENIPVLSDSEKDRTKKMKEKLVKSTLKIDKKLWAYIPASSEMINGTMISVQGFYMFNQEVSNNTYRIFLNDLIMQDKTDDFMKAVPDTAKWLINGKSFYEPMRKNYFWHPAYNDFPVLNVSREGAKLFCNWLTNAVNDKIKASYPKEKWESLFMNDLRIPAEEEWIIAARGGLGNVPYPWATGPESKGPQNSKGCYLCNFSIINYPDSLKKLSYCANDQLKNAITSAGTHSGDFYFTAKVNSYNPNNFGLYCMSGNVSEMVWQFKTGKPCAKGGSWNSDAAQIKINAEPELINEVEGSPYVGFRPVFTVKTTK